MSVNTATKVFMNPMTFLSDICEKRHVQQKGVCMNYLMFILKKSL